MPFWHWVPLNVIFCFTKEREGVSLRADAFSTLSTDRAIPGHEKTKRKREKRRKRYHFVSVKARGNNQTQQRETNGVKHFLFCRLALIRTCKQIGSSLTLITQRHNAPFIPGHINVS